MFLNYFNTVKRKTKNTLIILLLVTISGCSSTKDKFEKDLPSLPSDWSTSYQSLKNIDAWVETFKDKELKNIIIEAIEKSLTNFRNPYKSAEPGVKDKTKITNNDDVGYVYVEGNAREVYINSCFQIDCSNSSNQLNVILKW